jgi:hypothetical protein
MNSTAFSLLANNSSELNGNQEMELTIGSLSILIGPSGSSRLSDPTKQDPSASEPETVVMMEYSDGSSSEVNSPVSLEEVLKEIKEDDKAKEKLDAGVQLNDLMICLDDISDKSADTWKTVLELSEDDDSIFSSFNNNIGKQCQVLAIVGDNSEEFDENNSPVLNPANIDRGANHLVEGQTVESLTAREKIRLSVDEWKIMREAIEHGTPIPSNSSKEMLLGYHYALRQQAKQLAKEKIEIQREKIHPLQLAKLLGKHEATHHTSTQGKIIDTAQGTTTSSTPTGKVFRKTSTRPSYRSMSRGTSYQKLLKQH